MVGHLGRHVMRQAVAVAAAILALMGGARADPGLTVEKLLKDGWEIAGYVGTADVRSTVILFRNRAQSYLVQCSTFYDVTRPTPVVTNCYQVH